MRCYICDAEATIFSKRDNTYICGDCQTIIGETLAEFDVEDWVSKVEHNKFKERYVSLRSDNEDTSDLS